MKHLRCSQVLGIYFPKENTSLPPKLESKVNEAETHEMKFSNTEISDDSSVNERFGLIMFRMSLNHYTTLLFKHNLDFNSLEDVFLKPDKTVITKIRALMKFNYQGSSQI